MNYHREPYFFLHEIVRNDDHCPICRMYYLSVHPNKDEAIDYIKNQNKLDERNLEKLARNTSIWIDEWVRRNNGDLYELKPLSLPVSKIVECAPFSSNKIFLRVHIKVNRAEWCPDNIEFKVSFHGTLEEAQQRQQEVWIETFWNSELTDITRHFLPPMKAPMWVQDLDNDSLYHHYQVLELEFGQSICLNHLCHHLSEKVWAEEKKKGYTS